MATVGHAARQTAYKGSGVSFIESSAETII